MNVCMYGWMDGWMDGHIHIKLLHVMLFDLSLYQYLVISEDYKEAASFFDCRSPNTAKV